MPLFLLSALAVVFIAVLTLMPMPVSDAEPWIPYSDKVVHFLLFGTLSTVLCFDLGRKAGCLNGRIVIGAMAITVVYGAVVELLQGGMGLGRSADMADWLADDLGAVVCPMLLWKVLRRVIDRYQAVELVETSSSRQLMPEMRGLYEESFPVEERRPWEDIVRMVNDGDLPYHFFVIKYRGRQAGFISWWRLQGVIYIEHFAIKPGLRGKGIGTKVITAFVSEQHLPVILEVEPAGSTPMADRRIAFYTRCGFRALSQFDYVQPPYTPDLPSVPLMLMTTDLQLDPEAASSSIHKVVYSCENGA